MQVRQLKWLIHTAHTLTSYNHPLKTCSILFSSKNDRPSRSHSLKEVVTPKTSHHSQVEWVTASTEMARLPNDMFFMLPNEMFLLVAKCVVLTFCQISCFFPCCQMSYFAMLPNELLCHISKCFFWPIVQFLLSQVSICCHKYQYVVTSLNLSKSYLIFWGLLSKF